MYFPASVRIAAEHPALAHTVADLDRLIYEIGDQPLRPGVTADLLGKNAAQVERLLSQFEGHGLICRERRSFCPRCDGLLDGGNGGLWCDTCELNLPVANVHEEETFLVVDPIVRIDPTPDDDEVGQPAAVQFIAGDRGGAQRSQVQAPASFARFAMR